MAFALTKNPPPKNSALPDFVAGPTESGQSIKRQIVATTFQIGGGRCQIVFNGSQAFTTGSKVVLPALHEAHLYGQLQADCLKAYANHEGSHNRYTDFAMRKAGIEAAPALAPVPGLDQQMKELYASIHNIYEDHRIERLVVGDFPGTRSNLAALRSFLINRHAENIAEGKLQGLAIGTALQNALLVCGEAANHYEPADVLAGILDYYRSTYPMIGPFMDRALALLPGLSTDQDVHDLTRQTIVDLMALLAPQSDDTDEEADGDEPDAGNEDAADENGDQSDQGKPGQSGNGGDGESDADSDSSGSGGSGNSDGAGDKPSSKGEKNDKTDGSSGDPSTDESDEPTASGADGTDEPGQEPEKESDAGDSAGDEQGAEGEGGDEADGKDGSSPSRTSNEPREGDGEPEDGNNPGPPASSSPTDANDDGSAAQSTGSTGGPSSPGSGNSPQTRSAADIAEDMGSPIPDPVTIDDIVKEIVKQTAKATKLLGAPSGGAAYVETDQETVERPGTEAGATRDLRDPTLAGVVRSIIISRRRTKVETRREEGTFDNNAIIPLAIGDPDFFKRKTRRIAVAAAMEILVDASGSMSDIMQTALDTAQVTCEATAAFNHLKTAVVTYTATDEMNYVIVKEYHEHVVSGRKRFANAMASIRYGGTPTGRAMMFSIDRLSTRREEKKILVLVTDGMPDSMKEAIASQNIARHRGITTVLIEIGDHKKPHMAFDYGCVIKDISHLSDALRTIALELMAQTRVVRS
jgi:hypothetical protein